MNPCNWRAVWSAAICAALVLFSGAGYGQALCEFDPIFASTFYTPPNTGFSLGGYSTGAGTVGTADAQFTTDIPDDGGVALVAGSTQMDAVGFGGYTEGTALSPATGITTDGQHTWLRRRTRGTWAAQDTADNANDFDFVSVDGGSYGRSSILGAPGPETLASPVFRVSDFSYAPLDGTVSATVSPNRVRVPGAVANGALGTMEWRYTFTNTSGGTVTRLRLRVVEITTKGSPLVMSPQAELRVLDAVDQAVTVAGPAVVPVEGAVLESPPAQALGGGLGSSLVVDLGAGLAPGASVNVALTVGVQSKGNFAYWVAWEALP